ncbi:MAG: phosphoribosylformylglycinamidine synthase I [Candidatus Krumholzibacteriota bacterium]|nr:phosphoribosylformylglycinamidine synthase I [Candidatus Krumholzibacteriota bacterium]
MARSFRGKVAVIQFPGVNCESETVAAVRSVGLDADLFRWNEEPGLLEESAAVILPGGFSYQDRIRAGVVAAKDTVMDTLSDLAAAGHPLLGICNGAQVLVESGFIPGIHWERVDFALAPNIMEDREGYYCNWVYLRNEGSDSVWTSAFHKGEIIPVPVAHAEGRFVTRDENLLDQMKENGQIVLRYCSERGEIDSSFPVNPNGSMDNIAGVCNREGNVLAMMPHPERATWLRQVPEDLPGKWGGERLRSAGDITKMEEEGPGRRFFASLLHERPHRAHSTGSDKGKEDNR